MEKCDDDDEVLVLWVVEEVEVEVEPAQDEGVVDAVEAAKENVKGDIFATREIPQAIS